MITHRSFARSAFFLLCLLCTSTCSHTIVPSELILAGSTPGDEIIKSMLSLPSDNEIDFIRWNIKLDKNNSFVLSISYGKSQPNTLGFIGGGEKRKIIGTYSISKNENSNFKEIYHLRNDNQKIQISIVKLNNNLFHILTPQNRLMVGNGGWSYTLNRENTVASGEMLISSTVSDNGPLQLVFEGRTPCKEIVAEYPDINTNPSCFKLKWRLVLNRDSINYSATTYTRRKVVDGVSLEATGKWTIREGTPLNPNAIIYQIDPDKPDESISFLVGDDNVIFFLSKDNMPYIGNEDFSYTLNRIQ